MDISIKKMETDEEFKGKAFVHWQSWHEAYRGIIDQRYLDALTLEKCEETAYRWPDNILVAKDGDCVIGFVGYGEARDDGPATGEIFALYVLSEYYGKGVGLKLMEAGLEQLEQYPAIGLWVLEDNQRAIRFYMKCGFAPTGARKELSRLGAAEIRMARKK